MTEIQKQSMATLENLAEEINEEHRLCEEALKSGLAHALKAGELLVEAKGHTKHGEWGRWLAENFEGSVRTAQAYMRVANNRGELEKRNGVAHLSFRNAMKELATSVGDDADNNAFYAELLEIKERREQAETLEEIVEVARLSAELYHRKAEENVRNLREGGKALLQLEKEENQDVVRAAMRWAFADESPPPKLAEWRALAEIPDDLFEKKVAAFRRNPYGLEPTVGAMLKYGRKVKAGRD
jgi:hypothetical protein